MSRSACKGDDIGERACRARKRMYRAARLCVADAVAAPDRRFDEARQRLGPQHPAVLAAVAARNDLAATAEDVALAIAAGFARALPVLQRDEAVQEGRAGALRAAELWSPAGGASFTTYARRWCRKFVSALADRSRAVSIPERARLRGERIEMLEVDFATAADDEPVLDVEDELQRLGRALEQLPAAEVEALRRAFGRRRLGNLDESVKRTLDQLRLELNECATRCECGRAVPPGRESRCSLACARAAARRRYAQSLKGKRNNARRQARHRDRKKVTDKTSTAVAFAL